MHTKGGMHSRGRMHTRGRDANKGMGGTHGVGCTPALRCRHLCCQVGSFTPCRHLRYFLRATGEDEIVMGRARCALQPRTWPRETPPTEEQLALRDETPRYRLLG